MNSSRLLSPYRIVVLGTLSLSLSTIPSIAQERADTPPSPQIAVIDLAKAFERHPETAKATAQLTKDRAAAREIFKEKSEALKKVLQTHSELIRAAKKTEAAEKLKEANELEKAIATLNISSATPSSAIASISCSEPTA